MGTFLFCCNACDKTVRWPVLSGNFTPTSLQLHLNFNALFYVYPIKRKGGYDMFLGLEWYWWLVILVLLIVSIPFKVKFMKWWNQREKEKKKRQTGKWGEEDD